VRGGLAGAWLSSGHPPAGRWRGFSGRRPCAVYPRLAALGPSVVLSGFLFCTLLVVIAVAVIGGMRQALTAVVLGVLARVLFLAPPFQSKTLTCGPTLVSLAAFTPVRAAVATLIGKLAQLAQDQASSQRVEAAVRRVVTLVARAQRRICSRRSPTRSGGCSGRPATAHSIAWLAVRLAKENRSGKPAYSWRLTDEHRIPKQARVGGLINEYHLIASRGRDFRHAQEGARQPSSPRSPRHR
jgi:hypothetical protein